VLVADAIAAQSLVSERRQISSYAARALVDACMEYGARPNVPALAIAVVDPSGNLLAFQAMEGATETAIMTAQLKAKTAARWRRATEELFDRVNKQVNRAPEFVGDFPQPGGYPIFANGNGDLLGAVGAGGGAGEQDELCAKYALEKVFGRTAIPGRPR
jgi:glc operon protein GlcG